MVLPLGPIWAIGAAIGLAVTTYCFERFNPNDHGGKNFFYLVCAVWPLVLIFLVLLTIIVGPFWLVGNLITRLARDHRARDDRLNRLKKELDQ